MSDDNSWQDRYFGIAPRRRTQARSAAMAEWIAELDRAERQRADRMTDEVGKVREKHEQERVAREVERLRDLVEKFGVSVVEDVLHKKLPDAVAGRVTNTKRKGKRT